MNLSELKTKLAKSLDFLKTELAHVRAGRASPSLVDSIVVEAYGANMYVKELGSISVPEPQSLVISPWDRGLTEQITRAIRESGLNLNPVVEGASIRVPVPALTEERRKELVRLVATKVEETKNVMRAVRQDTMKLVDKAFTDKSISEDEKFGQKEEIEKTVKEYVSQADKVGEEKKQDLLKI